MNHKQLKNYRNYQIFDDGKIKNIKTDKFIKGTINEYLTVTLYPDKDSNLIKKSLRVHRIVAELFCENPNNYDIVNHINGNKLDNRASNLEWTTIYLNAQHASQNGLIKPVNYREVYRICPKTKDKVKYQSVTEAFQYNKDILKYDSYIIAVCSGKQKTAGGFIWKYVTNFENVEKPDGKIINGYENYLITSSGKIYNIKSGKFIKPSLNKAGYLIIDLHSSEYDKNRYKSKYTRQRNSKRKKFRVHRLVAEYFLENDNPTKKVEVNHKNKNRQDNDYKNLEWVTSLENLQHAHNKPVIVCDENGYFLNIFESLIDASKETQLNQKTISHALRKEKMHGGYIWKYGKKHEYITFKNPNGEILFLHPKYACLKLIE